MARNKNGRAQTLRQVSWNVNGLRAVLKKDFHRSVATLDVDILALQETKRQAHQLTAEMTDLDGYTSFFAHAAVKKGYSGVAAYSRMPP